MLKPESNSHLGTRSEVSNTILNYTIRLKSTMILILYMGYDRVDELPERYTCQERPQIFGTALTDQKRESLTTVIGKYVTSKFQLPTNMLI